MTERLDRIEAVIEANSAQIQANSAQIQTNSATIAELGTRINSLMQVVEINQRNQEVSQAELSAAVNSLLQVVEIHQRNFEVIMNEIRGIRTENQRILEHLFGQPENGK